MANGTGNAWHLPNSPEPPGRPGMRTPAGAVAAGAPVTLVTGNQSQGPGVAGDQMQAGSAALARKAGNAAWTAFPLLFLKAVGNNKYFAATLPADAFGAGDVVQYYFRIAYADRDTTFVHGSDARSLTTGDEAAAQAGAFAFAVRHALTPTGSFLTLASGPLEARVFRDTGHVALVGPDLAGAALANEVTISPPSVRLAGRTVHVGRVLSSADVPGGIEVVQELGPGRARVRLSFPSDGVLRYEVIDWGGPAPEQTSFSVAATPGERVYGMGEKFNALDQTGKMALVQTFDQPGNKGDRSYKVAPGSSARAATASTSTRPPRAASISATPPPTGSRSPTRRAR